MESRHEQYAALKVELKLAAEAAPQGSHQVVAKKVGISMQYSKDIRDRDGAKLPSDENFALLKGMVEGYRDQINKQIAKFQRFSEL